MIRYLLDTNVLIDILRNKRKDIIQKVSEKTACSNMVISFDEKEAVETESQKEPAETETKKYEQLSEPLDTDEKFFGFMNPIVNELVDLLKKLNEMIEAQFDKEEKAEKKFERDSFDEFCSNYKEAITPYCTEAFLKKWYRNSIGKPGDYNLLNENPIIYFTMKSELKAFVFIEPTQTSYGECFKFELRNENGKYLIDKMFYYFRREKIYHRMHWL